MSVPFDTAVPAALWYGQHIGPVLPVEAHGKAPLCRHGVLDASRDPAAIRQLFAPHPNANVGIATGAPGPDVVDIDDLAAASAVLALLDTTGAPIVATPRGRHYYFVGTKGGTVSLGFGELRRKGSYVVAPPSVHASGRLYVWLVEPNWPLPTLVGVGDAALAASRTAGRGEHRAPVRQVPHGERHDYLKDFAVRLARAGVLDERRLLAHLRCEFALSCEPVPAPRPGSLEALAQWAAGSRIADHQRSAAAAFAQRSARNGRGAP